MTILRLSERCAVAFYKAPALSINNNRFLSLLQNHLDVNMGYSPTNVDIRDRDVLVRVLASAACPAITQCSAADLAADCSTHAMPYATL